MARKAELEDDVLVEDEAETGEPEVLFIRLVDRKKSGFIMDLNGEYAGSKGTQFYHELDSPTDRFIPNRGYRLGYKEEMVNGKKKRISYHEPIRYIKEQTEISVQVQTQLGIMPHRIGQEDMIRIHRGEFSVVNEGSFVGLVRYLRESFYNKSNPKRPATATAIYEVVEPGKEEEKINELDLYIADAISFIGKLYQKGPKGYTYKTDKIDTLCQMFFVFAETYAGKITALNAIAKRVPKEFMERAEKMENVGIANVVHALELNVIAFQGNVVELVGRQKVVADLGAGNYTNDKKIDMLASLLATPDYKAINDEFLLELEIAKEKELGD